MQRSPENANQASLAAGKDAWAASKKPRRTVNDPPAALSSAEGPAAGFDEALPP